MRSDAPRAGRHAPGGEFNAGLTCDRCGEPSEFSYEGAGGEFLNLCPDCYRDLGRWLNE